VGVAEVSDPESGTATFGRDNSLINHGPNKINFIDLGGGKNMRGYWKDVFCEVHAYVYVIDSAAPERFEETKVRSIGCGPTLSLARFDVAVCV